VTEQIYDELISAIRDKQRFCDHLPCCFLSCTHDVHLHSDDLGVFFLIEM
jgi:hypothetical protein